MILYQDLDWYLRHNNKGEQHSMLRRMFNNQSPQPITFLTERLQSDASAIDSVETNQTREYAERGQESTLYTATGYTTLNLTSDYAIEGNKNVINTYQVSIKPFIVRNRHGKAQTFSNSCLCFTTYPHDFGFKKHQSLLRKFVANTETRWLIGGVTLYKYDGKLIGFLNDLHWYTARKAAMLRRATLLYTILRIGCELPKLLVDTVISYVFLTENAQNAFDLYDRSPVQFRELCSENTLQHRVPLRFAQHFNCAGRPLLQEHSFKVKYVRRGNDGVEKENAECQGLVSEMYYQNLEETWKSVFVDTVMQDLDLSFQANLKREENAWVFSSQCFPNVMPDVQTGNFRVNMEHLAHVGVCLLFHIEYVEDNDTDGISEPIHFVKASLYTDGIVYASGDLESMRVFPMQNFFAIPIDNSMTVLQALTTSEYHTDMKTLNVSRAKFELVLEPEKTDTESRPVNISTYWRHHQQMRTQNGVTGTVIN